MVCDAAGRVLQSTDPRGPISTFSYTSLGQPASTAFPSTANAPSNTLSYLDGANGRTQSVTDNRGTITLAYAAGNDRVSSVTDPVTGAVSYTYLLSGGRVTMTLPGGGMWTYGYGGSPDKNSFVPDRGHTTRTARDSHRRP